MADEAKNFSKVTVSTGYDGSATSIVLTTGHGTKLPTAPFNVVWWNSTDYPDPSDDPNAEVVRVTAISTDTLTVTRAQESTSASTKNTAGKTYKMLAGLTAGTVNNGLLGTKGADIASATTTDIGAATGEYVNVTGTTTITGLGTVGAGIRRVVNFTGVLVLTHNATSLILPSAASITTAAGDTAEFVSLGSGNWKCVSYTRASGNSLLGGGGASNFAAAYKSTDQTVSTGSSTKITFTSEEFDTGSDFDTTNSRYTAPSTGKYMLIADLRFPGITSTDYHYVNVYKNGGAYKTFYSQLEDGGFATRHLSLTTVLNLTSGDYIELYTESSDSSYTVSGGTENSGNRSIFQMFKLA